MNNRKITKVKLIKVPVFNPQLQSLKMNAPFLPPLALGRLTAYLRDKGLTVYLEDLNVQINRLYSQNKSDKFLRLLLDVQRVKNYISGKKDKDLEMLKTLICGMITQHDIDLIGISIEYETSTGSQMSALLVAKHLKELYSVPVVIGGRWDLSQLYQFGYESKIIDYYIRGPGEEPLFQLVKAIEKNGNGLKEVAGLMYYRDGKLICNQHAQEIVSLKPDFKGLPLKLYTWQTNGLFEHKFLDADNKKEILILPYKFIYGCPNKCIFCGSSGDNNLTFMGPEEVVLHLKELCREYKTRYFFFLSDTINISKEYIHRLCDEIIKEKLDILWSDCAQFRGMDKETLEKMRRAGCIRLIFGLETASQRLQQYVRKNIDLEASGQILRWAREAGIWVEAEIIAGLPTEAEGDIKETIKYLLRNSPYLNSVYINAFYLVDGSLLKNYPDEYGIENIQTIEEYATFKSSSPRSDYLNRYSFDEIGGLKWQDKIRQIDSSTRQIRQRSPVKERFLEFDQLPFLFYLYSQKINSGLIERIYYSSLKVIWTRCIFKNIISRPFFVIRKALEIRSPKDFILALLRIPRFFWKNTFGNRYDSGAK